MFSWVGVYMDLHLTYLPRKPHPLGWMVKTLSCALTGVLIRMELVMKKEAMAQLKYVAAFGATTACSLRLTEPWHHSKRILVGDSWFGSLRAVTELMKKGIYAVMAVKTGSAGFPKAELNAKIQTGRFTFFAMQRVVQLGTDLVGAGMRVLAAGWMDKKEMLVACSCRTTDVAPPADRIRNKYKDGAVRRIKYTVEQRDCHAFYRQHFNAIDIFNRLALGPGTVASSWVTKNGRQAVLKRFFMYTLACIETNAFKCHTSFTQEQDLSRRAWKVKLGDALIKFGKDKMQSTGNKGASTTPPAKKSRTNRRSSVNSSNSVTNAQVHDSLLGKPGSSGLLSPMGTKPNPQAFPRNPKQAKRQA